MTEAIPLPLMRIWCRKKDAWLSFRTTKQDYYFVNPSGYFVELPDRTLAPITARVAFRVVNCYPSIVVEELELQSGFSPPAYFVYAVREDQQIGAPQGIRLSSFRHELDQMQNLVTVNLTPPEKYVALRVLESGLVPEHVMMGLIRSITGKGTTLGQELVRTGMVSWEMLMGVCVDARLPSKLDPPTKSKSAYLREWELAGEILIAMDKITRTNLEYALKIKREGSRSIGDILIALGACSGQDIQDCLEIQSVLKDNSVQGASDTLFIGDLLVKRGIITETELHEAMNRQHIASQPLERLLVSLNSCDSHDIEDYRRMHGHGPHSQIDDHELGNWLIRTGRMEEYKLRQAMDIQARGRHFLGEILVAMGMCSHDAISNSVAIQADVRQAHERGLEKLGALLVAKGKVAPDALERAIELQTKGRRALGEILTAVSGCPEEDIALAIILQKQWRDRVSQEEDRLGEVLVKRGFLSEEILQRAIAMHITTGKPIGRVLVEEAYCTPEEIIATIVLRDYKRQSDLNVFIKKGMSARELPVLPPEKDGDKKNLKSTTERLISSWFKKGM